MSVRPCPVWMNARARPHALALVAGERRFTWADADREVSLAHARLSASGLRAGDRLVVLSRNSADLAWLAFGAARSGVVWIPLNARLTARELAPLVTRAAPSLVLAERALADRLPGAAALETFMSTPAPGIDPAPTVDDALDRAWLFTSGTTGVPRAAAVTGANFTASSLASARNLGGGAEACWLACLPLFHVGGLALLWRVAEGGGRAVLHEGFLPERVLLDVEAEAVTHLSVVPTGMRRLLQLHAGPAPRSLRAVLVGGGPCPEALLGEARSRGWPVLQTYGLTEATSQVATERVGEADGTTAGLALDGTKLRIEQGEIQVQGPTVMRGYAGDAEAAARAFTADGWLRTGDLGALDAHGRLTVFARRTDLVVTGGENVYPAEVEAVLLSHPAVEDAAVCGIPDPEWGQRVAAAVQLRGTVGKAELERHCRERLAGFKVPRLMRFVHAVPRNANGKVDRMALGHLFQKPA